VSINPVVVDKSGIVVGTGANVGTFTFTVADLALVDTDPADAEVLANRATLPPDGAVAFIFNAFVDGASLLPTEVLIETEAGVPVPSSFQVQGNAVVVFGTADLLPGNYTAKVTTGATVEEINGGTTTIAEEQIVRFVVAAP
jgi:hypothetical protein